MMTGDRQQDRVTHDDVVLTSAAKSKTFRLLSEYELREAVASWDGTLYRRADSDEYHLVNEKNDWVLSLRFEHGEVIIVTQMHVHNDYSALETYREESDPIELVS